MQKLKLLKGYIWYTGTKQFGTDQLPLFKYTSIYSPKPIEIVFLLSAKKLIIVKPNSLNHSASVLDSIEKELEDYKDQILKLMEK